MRLKWMRGVFFFGIGIFALAAVIAATLFYPPRVIMEQAARWYLDPSITWESVSRDGSRPLLSEMSCVFKPATLKVSQASLTHSIFEGLRDGAWEFTLRDVQIIPGDTKLPALQFTSGQGRWRAHEHLLMLRNWTSDAARIDVDVQWDSRGKFERLWVRGDANPAELREALKIWKLLKTEPTASERLLFELIYEKGSLRIEVDQKPFFRATWQSSNGAF